MVKLHFQERPWDLFAAVGYAVVMSVLLLGLNVGNLLAILLIFFIPGHVLVAALFPGNEKIGWMERVVLSFGLSIAVVPLLGLVLNFTPWGIRFAPIVVGIALFTVALGLVAYRSRMRLPREQRLSATLVLGLPVWKGYSLLDKGLIGALVVSILIASGTLAYVVLTPRSGQPFTEFFILGPGGNASSYPTALNVSETGTVILGIANHESASVNYTVRIDLVGVRLVYNATSGSNETIEVNRTTWSAINVSLANGANWTLNYTFSIPYIGLWKVQFFLFKNYLASTYLELGLLVRVT